MIIHLMPEFLRLKTSLKNFQKKILNGNISGENSKKNFKW
jgi:hypothetical protein